MPGVSSCRCVAGNHISSLEVPRISGTECMAASLPLSLHTVHCGEQKVYRAVLNDANGLRAVKRDGFMSDDSIKHGCSAIDEILGFIYRRP